VPSTVCARSRSDCQLVPPGQLPPAAPPHVNCPVPSHVNSSLAATVAVSITPLVAWAACSASATRRRQCRLWALFELHLRLLMSTRIIRSR
jgi:hypothetical protein